jgi:hypothetical protein
MGASARQADLTIAAEFFELFRTPREPATRGQRYTPIVSLPEVGGQYEYGDATWPTHLPGTRSAQSEGEETSSQPPVRMKLLILDLPEPRHRAE